MPETLKADLDHDFANNGKAHRKRMSEDLDTFRGWAVKAADAYAEGDRQLTEVLHISGRFTITPEHAEALSATPRRQPESITPPPPLRSETVAT